MTRKQKFVAICSNASCKYSYDYTFDDKIRHPSGCPRCGAGILRSCPHCKETLFGEKGQTLCTECKKPIKPDTAAPPAPKTRRGKAQDG